MIVAGDKALNYLSKPSGKTKVILAFGEDPGVVDDNLKTLISTWEEKEKTKLEIVRLQEDEVRKDFGLLEEALCAMSLLGEKQVLRLSLTSEHLTKKLQDFVKAIESELLIPENYLIIDAGELKKKSKLRQLFSDSKYVVALQFYSDSPESIEALIRHELAPYNIEIMTEAIEMFVSDLPSDRRMAKSEIEKLCLYGMELGRAITVDDMSFISSSEQPKGADDAADAALSGDLKQANIALDRYLDSGGSAVSALRVLHYRILRLLDHKSGARFLRPPVFEKDRSSFNRAANRWNTASLTRALSTLYAAEKTCKQSAAPTEAALKIIIDRIGRALI